MDGNRCEVIPRLEGEARQLEEEKKANDRRIAELTEREVNYDEVHFQEIHNLKKRNFEISIEVLLKKNEITRQYRLQAS